MKCRMCDGPNARYASFSGGREGYCFDCDDNFALDPNSPDAPRAVLLQTSEGREELRYQMGAELVRRQGVHVGGCNDKCDGDSHYLKPSRSR